jgi:hypothetical protein
VKDLIQDRGKYPLISPSEESTISRVFIYFLSNKCRGRDLLLVTPPWWTEQYTSLSRETETEGRCTSFTINLILEETKSTVISGTDSNKSHGCPTIISIANETLLYYTKEPQISAINCVSSIEQANASIMVARYTG